MPQQTKAKWARLKVGILAIVAMVIVAVLVFLITGNYNPFATEAVVYTYLNDAAALAKGAPVNLNGIPIGKVKDIVLSGSKDPLRVIRVSMQIPESELKRIPLDSVTKISAANLLGTKFINITIGKSPVAVKNDQELPSLNTAEFEDVVQQGYSILASLQKTVDQINTIVGAIQSGQGSIGKLLVDDTLYNRVLAIVNSVQLLANALNSDKGTIGRLIYDPELYNQVKGSLNRVDTLLQDIQSGQGTAGKLLKDPALYNDAQKTIDDLHTLVNNLNAGKGTAGKLLTSDELHQQILVTVAKVDTLIDKMNSGQGTVGQLLVNPQLYDNLNGTSRELTGLLKDFRANPKKFLRIKLGLF
jgi:phospholipid/cholesterol/gamma-HCH transport system substrate-binding protein